MPTEDLCSFTGASQFIVVVDGYFYTALSNTGAYRLSSSVCFAVTVISGCMLRDSFWFHCDAAMSQSAGPDV